MVRKTVVGPDVTLQQGQVRRVYLAKRHQTAGFVGSIPFDEEWIDGGVKRAADMKRDANWCTGKQTSERGG